MTFMSDQPWYKTVKDRKVSAVDDIEIDLKRKNRLDPMTQVNELLKEREKSKKRKKDEHEHKEKKHKKRAKIEDEKAKSSSVVKVKTIEQLRAERLKRESEERVKAQRLMLGIKDTHSEPKIEVDDRKRRYNNQFNPEISKY